MNDKNGESLYNEFKLYFIISSVKTQVQADLALYLAKCNDNYCNPRFNYNKIGNIISKVETQEQADSVIKLIERADKDKNLDFIL